MERLISNRAVVGVCTFKALFEHACTDVAVKHGDDVAAQVNGRRLAFTRSV